MTLLFIRKHDHDPYISKCALKSNNKLLFSIKIQGAEEEANSEREKTHLSCPVPLAYITLCWDIACCVLLNFLNFFQFHRCITLFCWLVNKFSLGYKRISLEAILHHDGDKRCAIIGLCFDFIFLNILWILDVFLSSSLSHLKLLYNYNLLINIIIFTTYNFLTLFVCYFIIFLVHLIRRSLTEIHLLKFWITWAIFI